MTVARPHLSRLPKFTTTTAPLDFSTHTYPYIVVIWPALALIWSPLKVAASAFVAEVVCQLSARNHGIICVS
jgi:hypothetical protein